jgi:uncharacterized protein (DUF849 family)
MGMVMMSKRELNCLDVLARLDSERLTARAAAELMTVTPRQTYRLLRRYRDGGASAMTGNILKFRLFSCGTIVQERDVDPLLQITFCKSTRTGAVEQVRIEQHEAIASVRNVDRLNG